MTLPQDYAERVYAGVLGKIIGVYLGRPFEGWPYEKLTEKFGEINYYVHEHFEVPLIVTVSPAQDAAAVAAAFGIARMLPNIQTTVNNRTERCLRAAILTPLAPLGRA